MSKALELEKQAYKALLRKRKSYNYKAPKVTIPARPVQRASSARPVPSNDIVADILNNREKVAPTKPEENKPDDFWGSVGKGIGEGFTNFVNTPVIKTALDVLSTGGYATANIADQYLTGLKNNNPGQMLTAIPTGIGKGFSGGFGGNNNDALTYSKLMDKHLGEVSEGDTAGQWTRGITGFAGDVLLDPTTYLTLGGAAAVKAGVKGATNLSAANKVKAKLGPEAVNAPIKYKNRRQAFAKEYANKRAADKLANREMAAQRKLRRLAKKGKIDPRQIEDLVDSVVTGLEPAVALRNIDAEADKVQVLSRNFEDKNPELAAAITAPADVANALNDVGANKVVSPEDIPIVDVDKATSLIPSMGKPNIEVAPEPRLGTLKPPTTAQRLVEELSGVRAVAPVPKGATQRVIDKEGLTEHIMKAGGKVKLTNGKETTWSRLRAEWKKNPKSHDRIIKSLPDSITGQYQMLAPASPDPSKTVGNISKIIDDIRAGTIEPSEGLKTLANSDSPQDIAKFVNDIAKTEDFKKSADAMRKYSAGNRVGPRFGEREAKISAQSAVPSQRYSKDDIIASKVPATAEESLAWREAKYTQVATELANHKFSKDMRTFADKIFNDAVGLEKIGVTGVDTIHASIRHFDKLVYEAYRLAPKSPNMRDSIIMGVMKDVDNRLRLAGIEPYLQNVALKGDNFVVRLAPSDVLELLTPLQRNKYLWGSKDEIHKILPTTVLDLAEVLVRGTTKLGADGRIDYANTMENAIKVLQGSTGLSIGQRVAGRIDTSTYEKNLEQIVKTVAGKDSQAYKDFTAKTYIDDITGKELPNTHARKVEIADMIRTSRPEAYLKAAQDRMDSTVVELLSIFTKGWKEGKSTVLSDLVNTNMRNAAVFSGSVAKKVNEVATEHMARLQRAITEGTPDEVIHELVTRPPFPWKGKDDPTTRRLLTDAQKAVQDSVVTRSELNYLQATAKNVANASKPVNSQVAAKNNAEAYEVNPELAEQTAKLENGKPTEEDLEKIIELSTREMNANVIMRAFGFSRLFNARAGMGITYETVTSSAHATTHIMTAFHNILKQWSLKGIGKEEVRVAFKEIQSGEDVLSPFAQELADTLKFMFSPENASGAPISNFLTRNTVGPAHFNRVLRSVGFDSKIKVDETATPAEMAVAWKEWDIENPIDFFSKMMHAMMKTSEDVSIGASITRKFGKDKPEPGYAKVSDKSGKNQLLTLIDLDKYYPVEVIDEFTVINQFMTASRSFDPKHPAHAFITQVFDPVISTLKLTQTTLKPGHHVMSIIGDMWRNHLMGVKRNDYKKAIRVIHSNKGSMKGMEPLEQWAKVKEQLHAKNISGSDIDRSEVMVFHGKPYKVGHDQLYMAAKQRGIILPAHIGSTDIDELADFHSMNDGVGNAITRGIRNVSSKIDRIANPNHGKYSINKFSAARDNFSRMALFMRYMQEKPFKTFDEAVDYASDKVKLTAPTANDLGAFEAKYMRRGVFYYTWLRGMIPRIIEGSLTRPGVAMIPSKLMYNWAQANGLDPMSIGDPFPEGTLFPDWYQERVLGPQWKNENNLWGLNPTGPVVDVLNTVGSGVTPGDIVSGKSLEKFSSTAFNMSTPWFKAPVEIGSGRRLDGGAPIEGPEYLQDMIGPVRLGSRISGKTFAPGTSPEGDFNLFPNRSGSKYADGLGDDFGDNALHELINWLTGLQFTNYTNEQSKNAVEFQEKERLREERKLEQRYGG